MGTPACILMDQEKYSPERLLSDAIVAAFHADLMLFFRNRKRFEEGKFLFTTLNILDPLYEENLDKQFIFYVDSADDLDETFYHYEDLGLDPNQKLCRVGDIEELHDAEEVVFRFIYQYLKMNPDDYFWVPDYDWIYRWEDMQKLKSLPYDPYWCYKDPKLIK